MTGRRSGVANIKSLRFALVATKRHDEFKAKGKHKIEPHTAEQIEREERRSCEGKITEDKLAEKPNIIYIR